MAKEFSFMFGKFELLVILRSDFYWSTLLMLFVGATAILFDTLQFVLSRN